MHNSRGNGSSRYDTQSTSSGSYDRWHDDSDWSSRNETWRGSSNRSPRRSEPSSSDYRHRNDSWKEETYRDGFRHGRDRAPMPVDDQFLVRYGAKRLQNGNLVDRDGHILRVRDPDCRAPSPPRYNPGRDTRRADIRSGAARRDELNRMSKSDIDRKARQQMELVKEMAENAEKESLGEMSKKTKDNKNEKKKTNGNSEVVRKNSEEEGEDEYEEEDDAPPAKKSSDSGTSSSSLYANNIKKALLMAPRFAKRTLLPGGPSKPSSAEPPVELKAGSPNDSTQKSWFRQYQEHVDELKKKVYRPPSFGPGAPPPPSSTGYFFQSPPPAPPPPQCGPFGGPLPPQKTPSSTSSSPYYSGNPVTTYGTPFGEIYSNPTSVPLQMALPPPGVVGIEKTRDSGASGAFQASPGYSESHRTTYGASGSHGAYSTPSGASGAFTGSSGASRAVSGHSGASGAFQTSPGYSEGYRASSGASGAPGAYSTTFGASGAVSGHSGASGAFQTSPGYSDGYPMGSGAFGAPGPHSGGQKTSTSSGIHGRMSSNNGNYGIIARQAPQSSDSEEEDEAILKLREIIRNCGSSAKR